MNDGPATLPFLPLHYTRRLPLDAPALCDDGSEAWMTYGDLAEKVGEAVRFLVPERRALVLCCVPRSIDGVVAYLASAQAGHAVALADPAAPNLASSAQAYEPEWIVAPPDRAFDGYEKAAWPVQSLALFRRKQAPQGALHPDFYLMLLTSGSTGSSKGVRLSYANIASNTDSIIDSQRLTNEAVALGHLPLPYSFGLSILQTHLALGARVVLSEKGLMDGGLWDLARARGVTLFPGVPYHYEMLTKLGLARLKVPTLKMFLQAGGKMQLPLTQRLLEEVRKLDGGKLFIMYGQTEASPRISCFPLHERPEKIGSSGLALKGGRLAIEDGEVVYSGPNVMMGPAQSRADLAGGDVMGGRLVTGDLGEIDAEGYLTITGRKQRFAKLFGQRVALDDLEKIASPLAFAVAIELPEKIAMVTTCADPAILAEMKERLVAQTKLPAPWIEIRTVDEIPHKPTGKIDYQKMQAEG